MNENDSAISSDQHSTCNLSNGHPLARPSYTQNWLEQAPFDFYGGGRKLRSSFLGSIIWQRKHGLGVIQESLSLSKGVEGHLCFFVSHKSLASILENLKSKCSARTERWSLCLWPHDARVIYRAGTNSPADCVSCHPSCETKPTRREEMVVGTLVREVRPLHQGGRATFRIAGQWEGLLRAHF